MPLKRSCKSCNLFSHTLYVWMFAAFGLTILASCSSFEHLTRVTDESFPQAKQCGKCHVEIYQEWANSDHAKAYTNPHFRRATNNYSFKDCLSCHAPQPFRIDKPVTRRINRKEGITCVSCHLEEGKLFGPLDPTGIIAPHPIGVEPDFYKNSEMCGTCHQGEFAEWQKAHVEGKQTCQDCHMPEIIRKVTQPTGGISNVIVAFEEEVSQKRHDFSIITSNLNTDMISIGVEKENTGQLTLVIKNNLPHFLPAGDFGFRVLVLETFVIQPDGNQTLLDRMELAKELKTAISPSGTLDWKLKIPPETDFLRIKISRLSYAEDDIIYLYDKKVPVS